MEKNKSLLMPVLLYGCIIGGVMVLHSVLMQMTNSTFSTYGQIMAYVLPFLLMLYSLHAYRQEYNGGILRYSQGIGMGTMFSIVSSVITVLYLIILVKFIDPDYLEMVNRMAEEKMLEKGLNEDMIERSMAMTKRFRSLGFMSVAGFFGGIIVGIIYSLIIMIFLKKEPSDPFVSVAEN